MGPRPHLERIEPYAPGKPVEELERELGIAEAIKLASNENPLGPSPMAVAAMQAAAAHVHRYPDTHAFDLRARLAALHGVQPDELAFGHGSNELIDLICRAFAGPSDHAVIGTPSFVCYRLSLLAADVPMTEVPLDQGLYWNPDRLLEAVRPSTKLLFLDNPNNPTSTHLGRDALGRLLAALPSHVIPVVDEAYFHYADAADYVSALELRGVCPRLVVLRTFSKAFGLAAARAGYAVGPAELLSYLPRVGVPFNLNGIAQAGALAALDDREHVARSVDLNRSERPRLRAALVALGFEVAPSQANFLCVEAKVEAAVLYARLLRQGVIVRPIAGMPRHLRISIGLASENDRLLQALRTVWA
ncbi:MAG: histidinol-phosphate transaminase [Polyangiales bacterium]